MTGADYADPALDSACGFLLGLDARKGANSLPMGTNPNLTANGINSMART